MSLAVRVAENSKNMGFDDNKVEGKAGSATISEGNKGIVADFDPEIENDGGPVEGNRVNRQMSESSIYTTDHEEDDDEANNKIELGPQCTLKETFEKDKDDESLRRWKEQLLGSVDINAVGESLDPEVKILSLAIKSPGRSDIVLPIPEDGNPKSPWFVLKEGSKYSLKFTFQINNNIVTGLKYTNAVWKTGIKVDSTKQMIGAFSPQLEPYTHEMPEETTPSGIFARGSYSARTKFLDDDNKCYLEINYTFEIKKEWQQKFTFRELAAATNNFRPESFIGEGGFGRVYKGQLPSGQVVAVKQLDRNGLQGNREFLVEVLMLSLLHHPNLVNLIGYCADGDQRLLVYEFMPLGSLEDHLHDLPPDKEPLDWNTRMTIASGAAKGLEHLHDKANPPVIYRDFKSSNILLKENFFPKLSDFGLAKLGPTGDKSHVSTRVMGTYGYCAPEYAMTGQLTVKSDVYSFGVVFLELITGRKAIDSTKPQGEQNLVAWARPLFNDRRKFAKLADPSLQGQFPMRGLYQALAVASMCIQEQAAGRPLIGDVVTALSYLANQSYDPGTVPGQIHRFGADSVDRRNKDDRVGRIFRNEDGAGGGSGQKWDVDGGSEKEDSPRETARMLNRDLDRERAVAEAKMWGENWRDKRRQNGQGSFDGGNE